MFAGVNMSFHLDGPAVVNFRQDIEYVEGFLSNCVVAQKDYHIVFSVYNIVFQTIQWKIDDINGSFRVESLLKLVISSNFLVCIIMLIGGKPHADIGLWYYNS